MSKEMGEMGRSRQVGQAGVSAPLEGARRATGLGAEGASAGAAPLASGQRWSAGRKRDVVLRLLRGDSDVLGARNAHPWPRRVNASDVLAAQQSLRRVPPSSPRGRVTRGSAC